MNNNRCVYCGVIIPERGRLCPACEGADTKVGSILQSLNVSETEVEKAYKFMEKNDDI